MADNGEVCPHLDCIGEVTKEELLQKSKVGVCVMIIQLLTLQVQRHQYNMKLLTMKLYSRKK